jgi:ferritin-like metal-binding protein YciE
METFQSMQVQREFERDEFESALVAELVELRRSEKALQKMYPRLKSKPQLRERFLEQLAEMQQRAHRLDAVLNPLGALHFAEAVSAPVHSSVA